MDVKGNQGRGTGEVTDMSQGELEKVSGNNEGGVVR